MGWTFRKNSTRAQLVASILRGSDFTVKPEDADYYSKYCGLNVGDRRQTVILKSHDTIEAVWYLARTTTTRVNGTVETQNWIGVSLIEGGGTEWGNKDMDASMGPYVGGCPVEWLKEIEMPKPEEEALYDWYMGMKGTPVKRCSNCRKLDCAGHAKELIVLTAWGHPFEDVPAGMVGVGACYGGRLENGGEASKMVYHLVPKEEYRSRKWPEVFAVDPERHPVWERTGKAETKHVVFA